MSLKPNSDEIAPKISNLRIEHGLLLPLARRMHECLYAQLTNTFEKNEITLGVPIEMRVKDMSSIEEKIDRKALSINSIAEVKDFVGIRTILLFEKDTRKTSEIISNMLEVIEFDDAADKLETSQFGYNSRHYIVKLPKAWLEVPNYSDLGNLVAEIQVRTLAQHIWAVASHKLQYKREASVPLPLRRTISRVSALLETVDVEFSRVLDERENYIREFNESPEDKILDVDLIASILDIILPPANKYHEENYDELLEELEEISVVSKKDLEDLISKNLQYMMNEDRRAAAGVFLDGGQEPDEEERAEAGVYFTHTGLVRLAIGLSRPEKEKPVIDTDDLPL
jgi:putative GTP pyrophosphokinase